MKKHKKCVTFWIDEDLIKEFDKHYKLKSLFMRECVKQAIKNRDFYIQMTMGENENGKEKIL